MVKGVSNYQEIKQFILDIENKYPVDQWGYNDIPFWPHIRIQLYYALIHSLKDEITSGKNDIKIPVKSTSNTLNRFQVLWNSFISYRNFFKNVTTKDVLFMSLDMHKVQHNGDYFNRFFDSIISSNGLEKNSLTFEIKKNPQPCYNSDSVHKVSSLLDYHYKKYSFANRFKKKKVVQSNNIHDIEKLTVYLKNQGLDKIANQLTEDKLNRWTFKIRAFSNFYIKYLKKSQTKKVIAVSYYGFDSMWSCMYAANLLSIPTVDFQHGPQTEVHMAYASWTKIPKNGFSIMPKEYWCWDEESAKEINKWAITAGTIAKVYGQPWLTYIQNKQTQKGIEDKKPIVLYTLQTFPLFTLENTFTPEIIQLIKISKYKWVLRLHPSNAQDAYLIENYLDKYDVEKDRYLIQGPRGIPLPEVLTESILHVTNYSGCTIEARELGVKTVLIDSVGLEVFKSYIDNQLVVYMDKKKDGFYHNLEEVITSTIKNKKRKIKEIPNPLRF